MRRASAAGGIQWVVVCNACDVRRDKAAKTAGTTVEEYGDYRCVIDRKDIEATLLATEDPQVARAMAFIVEQAGRGIKAQDVADAVALPRRSLDAAFQAALARSLYAEILHVRLEHSRRLISNTNLPLKQIAAATGFRSVQHMSAQFRRTFGHPPAAYRRTVAGSPVIAG